MPCTSPFPPTAQHHHSFSEIFIISKGAYQPGSSPSHTAGPSVLSLLSFYPHQFSIGGTCRQSCRVEAEHPHAQRTALYYRSRLTASPGTRSQRTSHRRAISRPGQKGHRDPIHPPYADARDCVCGRKHHVSSRTGASPMKKSGSELLQPEGSAAY